MVTGLESLHHDAHRLGIEKVLVVDDDDNLRAMLVPYLNQHGFPCEGTDGADAALAIIRRDPAISVVLSDIRMPEKSGIDLLAEVRGLEDHEVRFIIMTAHAELDQAIAAVRLGAHDFLEKPFDMARLRQVIEDAQTENRRRRLHRLVDRDLETEVMAKMRENDSLLSELHSANEKAIQHLAIAAEYKDAGTGDHIKRIGRYARVFAENLGWSAERCDTLCAAAALHDIGKIGTPDRILLKRGILDPAETREMQRHCEIGTHILSGSANPVVKCAAVIALGHHECWDGSGYPAGLEGGEIPIEARITAICDVYDALRSARPYKPPLDHATAVSIILDGNGRTRPGHFDPRPLAVFRSNADTFDRIFRRSTDTGFSGFADPDPVIEFAEPKGPARYTNARRKAVGNENDL